MALTAKQQRFVDEYLKDLNATQAAIRAGYSKKTANVIAAQNLSKLNIQSEIADRMNVRGQKASITQTMVLERLWMIATANPNELIEHRRICCRHCFGAGHSYQWKTKEEFERESVLMAAKGIPPQTDDGGFGYDATVLPHPKCPNCHGEGLGRIHARDSRTVSPAALALYAGVKQTKDGGFEVKMHDQLAALDKVAKHLGMFSDKASSPLDDEIKKLEIERRRAELKLIEKGGGNSNAQLLADLIAGLPS
ncbi:terminase small subunit [Pseudomonas sp. CCC3.2]|uniref:terminase small subunit n=1 Tax=unclassified Pseudomonas TaxID=196821 RepID=UPI002AB5C4C5|nr:MULTISPECIES: terminase small subunit [unclassified Pseudomonas]MDY7559950.1 terminase small subunit [Pseudomonas sp. AB6]MEA9994550.1 terminase small subunit [Pseudomonas sp. AA4]MEB0085695.1 terminase small subunit [Pseudomonas sp. RTI1]MEB0125980.1 terminase small subunit [Pseudomonas sp. CCC1.2]MEB0152784.1 terminase small subunit [Pseudomonas sp. CCC4.3]